MDFQETLIKKNYGNILHKIAGIGVGSIGPLDLSKGRIVNPPNIPLGVINIVKPLYEEFRVPVYLVNDCVAAVYGEKFTSFSS